MSGPSIVMQGELIVTDPRQPSCPRAVNVVVPASHAVEVTDAWLQEIRPRVVRLARRFLWNTHDAEEVAQEALTLIWRRAGRLRDPGKRNAWLYRTTINLSIGRLRRKQVQGDLEFELQAADTAEAWQQAEAGSLTERVRHVMSELPDRQQAAIVLRDVEGMDYADIAAILRTRSSTARVLVHRAREKVREILLRRWPDTFGPDR